MKTVVDAVAGGVVPTPAAKPRRIVNRIALVVDKSSSIDDYNIRGPMLKAMNDQLMAIKKNAYDMNQATWVSLYFFNEFVQVVFDGKDSWSLEPVDRNEYRPEGMTAIGDAVNKATWDLTRAKLDSGTDTAFLVLTITDGEQNRGRLIDLSAQKRFDFTYAFLVPNDRAREFLLEQNVPVGNIRLWEQTVRGTEEASRATADSFRNYYTSRSQGATRTTSFFTDLSGVTAQDLRKLEDVTGKYRRFQVTREDEIASFVRAAGIDYELGRALYELTKREKVQSHKAVVIEDKATKKLYGGDEAKRLVGIVTGAGVTASVAPGNHANYRIYVGSTSMNRKLVRGTTLLYEK